MRNKVTRIAIVEDHEIFMKGLEKLLCTRPDVFIAGTYPGGLSFLKALPTLNLDLLLLDVQLPDTSPEELLKNIRQIRPRLPVLYLTLFRGSRLLHRLQKLGVQRYILKDAPIEELHLAIRTVAAGREYFNSETAPEEKSNERNTVTTPGNKLRELLSPREYEILKLVCEELSSAEIGERLFLSTGTVDTHRRNTLVKLGVSNTVGLVKFALQNGILDED